MYTRPLAAGGARHRPPTLSHPHVPPPVLGRYETPPGAAAFVVRLLAQACLAGTIGVVVAKVASTLFPAAFSVVTLLGSMLLLASVGLRWVLPRRGNPAAVVPVATAGTILLALTLVLGGEALNLVRVVIGLIVVSVGLPLASAMDNGIARLRWRTCLLIAVAALLMCAAGWAFRAAGNGLVLAPWVVSLTLVLNLSLALAVAGVYAAYFSADQRLPLSAVTAAAVRWQRAFAGRERWYASPVMRCVAILSTGLLWIWGPAAESWNPAGGWGLAVSAGGLCSAIVFRRTWAVCLRAVCVWLTYNAAGRTLPGVYQPAGWLRPVWARRAGFIAVTGVNAFAARLTLAAADAALGAAWGQHANPAPCSPTLIVDELLSLVLPVLLPIVGVFAVAGSGLHSLRSAVFTRSAGRD